MRTNMGTADRVARIMAAIVIAALYLSGILDGTVAIVLLIVAVAFIVTSFLGVCPLYLPFGISTLRRRRKS